MTAMAIWKKVKTMSDLISRDDAIRELNGACSTWEDDAKVQEIVKALPSAETLQNLARPNKELIGSDLISREVVLANIDERLRANGYGNVGLVSELNRLVGYVRNIPSAEVTGDLISRQWLLEVYGDYIGDNGEPKYHVPLEVVRQNILDAPSAEAVQGCDGCRYNTRIPQEQCLRCKRYWRDSYERKGGDTE